MFFTASLLLTTLVVGAVMLSRRRKRQRRRRRPALLVFLAAVPILALGAREGSWAASTALIVDTVAILGMQSVEGARQIARARRIGRARRPLGAPRFRPSRAFNRPVRRPPIRRPKGLRLIPIQIKKRRRPTIGQPRPHAIGKA